MKKAYESYHELKYYRQVLGSTQQDFARLLGLTSASSYTNKEAGRKRFYLEEAMTLTNHINEKLNIDLDVRDIFLNRHSTIGNK